MKYITFEPAVIKNKLVCNHPRIKHFWEYGFCSVNPIGDVSYGIGLIVDNETEDRHDFSGKTFDEAASKAENFLSTLECETISPESIL